MDCCEVAKRDEICGIASEKHNPLTLPITIIKHSITFQRIWMFELTKR